MNALYPNQLSNLSYYRADYGDVWAVCSRVIRLHTAQCMSVMGFVSTSETFFSGTDRV